MKKAHETSGVTDFYKQLREMKSKKADPQKKQLDSASLGLTSSQPEASAIDQRPKLATQNEHQRVAQAKVKDMFSNIEVEIGEIDFIDELALAREK